MSNADRVELVKKYREIHQDASLKNAADAVNAGWTPEKDATFFDADPKWAVGFSGIMVYTGKEVSIGLINGLTKDAAEQFRKQMFAEVCNGDQIIEFDNGITCGKITLPHYAVYSLFVTDNI